MYLDGCVVRTVGVSLWVSLYKRLDDLLVMAKSTIQFSTIFGGWISNDSSREEKPLHTGSLLAARYKKGRSLKYSNINIIIIIIIIM